MARAALGLLRVCQRLLPYKEDTADALLRSLQLLLRLSPAAAWELAQPIATEVSLPSSGSAVMYTLQCHETFQHAIVEVGSDRRSTYLRPP